MLLGNASGSYDLDSQGAAKLAQESYDWPGRQRWLDDFSDVSAIPLAHLVPSEQYFDEFRSSYGLPSDMVELLDALYGLTDTQRERFLRAAYWLEHATEITSGSAMHVALVQAIEAIMPSQSREACPACGKPMGDGPTAIFREFVDEFSGGLPEQHRKAFYSVRSSLTHGRALHRWDGEDRNSPIAIGERLQLVWLFRIVRVVLVNWLQRQSSA